MAPRSRSSQGSRSSSVRGMPWLIFSTFDIGWKSSASANCQPKSDAKSLPIVVFPAPTTPITITIIAEVRLSLFRIGFLHACTRVGESKTSVGFGGNFERFPFAVFLHIRDVLGIDVVVFVGLSRVMKLPEVFQARRLVHNLPSSRAGTLASAVVKDCDS